MGFDLGSLDLSGMGGGMYDITGGANMSPNGLGGPMGQMANAAAPGSPGFTGAPAAGGAPGVSDVLKKSKMPKWQQGLQSLVDNLNTMTESNGPASDTAGQYANPHYRTMVDFTRM